jgi:hypothetical protein
MTNPSRGPMSPRGVPFQRERSKWVSCWMPCASASISGASAGDKAFMCAASCSGSPYTTNVPPSVNGNRLRRHVRSYALARWGRCAGWYRRGLSRLGESISVSYVSLSGAFAPFAIADKQVARAAHRKDVSRRTRVGLDFVAQVVDMGFHKLARLP